MFEPLNGLERLLMAAARDPAERATFTKALLASEVYVSPTAAPDDGRVGSVRAATLPSGESGAAVFTAPERLTQVCGRDARVMVDTGRTLLEWLRPGPVFLNPGLDYAVTWSREELAQLLDGLVTETLDKPLTLLLAHPAVRPAALIARLTAAFAGAPAVRGAWLMLCHRADEPEQTWMMGVEHAGDWPAVQAATRRALDGFTLDRRLDVLDLNDRPDDTLRTGIPLKPAPRPQAKRGLFGFFR